ncbi:hypothetical protein FOZ60_002094 [Perkinsus olseni]|uniref:Major facilitator superfamily (MFS) profile domain-containing protein n=1 Tax=Perkinsus olseni TaxID=32597 RepID=A0A7J6P189_PEROL|nr:hypothetical protein FOZ60_002094 [Perkinsus olseni]
MDEGAAASIMVASYAVGTTVGSLISGPISDRIGRRPVFLAGLTLFAASYFLAAISWNLMSFACFRALGGLASGNRPVFIAFLADISDPRDSAFYGVLLATTVNAAISIGPMIGGALALVKLEFPLYLFGGISCVLLVLLFFVLRESHHDRLTTATTDAGGHVTDIAYDDRESYPNRWLFPTIAMLALTAFCARYMITGWSTVFGLLGAERYGLNSAQNGLSLGLQACVLILLSIGYIPITRAVLSPALTAAVGLAVSSLLVVVPFLHNVYWTTAIGAAPGIGCCCFFSGMVYFITILSPGSRRGFFSSFVYTSSNIGAVCGPIFSGTLYDADPSLFTMSCGLYIPGLCSNCAGRKAMMLQDLCKRHGLPCKLYNYPHWDCPAKLDYSSVYNAARDSLLDVATAKSPAVVLAASMGCHFSLRLALDYPDLIKAIVSVGGSYNPGACWRLEDSSEWVYVASQYAEDDGAYKVPKAFLRDMQANYISNFEDIRVPVEVVHGTNDESVPVETGERLARLLPGGSLHLIEGGDHRLSTEEDLRIIEHLLEKYLVD